MRCCAVQHKKCALSKCAKRSAGKRASIVRVCMRILRATGIGKTPFEQGRRFTHPSPALRAVSKAWKGKTASCEKGTGTRSAVSDGWQRIVHLSCILLLGCLPAGGASETVRPAGGGGGESEQGSVCSPALRYFQSPPPVPSTAGFDFGQFSVRWALVLAATVLGIRSEKSAHWQARVSANDRKNECAPAAGPIDTAFHSVAKCPWWGKVQNCMCSFVKARAVFFFGGDSSENLNY